MIRKDTKFSLAEILISSAIILSGISLTMINYYNPPKINPNIRFINYYSLENQINSLNVYKIEK